MRSNPLAELQRGLRHAVDVREGNNLGAGDVAKRAGRHVYVAAMREELRKVLSGLEADRDLDPERVYPDRVVALEAALEQIRRVS